MGDFTETFSVRQGVYIKFLCLFISLYFSIRDTKNGIFHFPKPCACDCPDSVNFFPDVRKVLPYKLPILYLKNLVCINKYIYRIFQPLHYPYYSR